MSASEDDERTKNAEFKVLIVAGGTGGHVFPGLAVARELLTRGHTVEWLGTRKGIESSLVPRENIPLFFSEITGVRGKGLLALLLAPLNIWRAINNAKVILKQRQPQVVLGLGGFVAGPGGMAARMLKIPLVIHEQNAVAGTTNKILSRFAQSRLSAFSGALKNSAYVGNPVRKSIENIATPEERFLNRSGKPRVLILGGSRGARALNNLLPQAFSKSSFADNCEIVHQCGEGWVDETTSDYEKVGVNANVKAFIDDVAASLAWADLVICRSGALTVAELSAVGVGSVLIPFPYAIDDHQTANARFLESGGAALIKQQREISPEIIAVTLNELLVDRGQLLTMAKAARKLAKTEVDKRIADECEQVSLRAKRSVAK